MILVPEIKKFAAPPSTVDTLKRKKEKNKKETACLFICNFWNDQWGSTGKANISFLSLLIKANYTDQKELLPNFQKIELNKQGVFIFGWAYYYYDIPYEIVKWRHLMVSPYTFLMLM